MAAFLGMIIGLSFAFCNLIILKAFIIINFNIVLLFSQNAYFCFLTFQCAHFKCFVLLTHQFLLSL
jgi:hypothetical protein